jgi:hypothetical protein
MLEWIEPEAWQAFHDMRKRIKAPLTPYAEKLIVRELVKLKTAGHDPQACLDQSIMNSWRDVFPLRDKGIKTTAQSNADFERYAREAAEPLTDPAKRRAAIELAKSAIKRVA